MGTSNECTYEYLFYFTGLYSYVLYLRYLCYQFLVLSRFTGLSFILPISPSFSNYDIARGKITSLDSIYMFCYSVRKT